MPPFSSHRLARRGAPRSNTTAYRAWRWLSPTTALGLLMCLFSTTTAQVLPRADAHLRRPEPSDGGTDLVQQQQPDEWQRQHVVRRVYDSPARKAIHEVELRMERYQTGLPPDPDHIVPYKNHPFERSNRSRRNLEDAGDNSTAAPTANPDEEGNEEEEQDGSRFQPMRIRFETKALDDMRDSATAAKIDWIKTQVLPRTAEYWSSALSVVPVSGNLRINAAELDNRLYCGDPEFSPVPADHISSGVPDADLVLYVSASSSPLFCPERTLAVAVPCNFDQFDRPIAGSVNVCLDEISLLSDGTATPAVLQDYVDVCIHEVGHVLGHSSNSYRFFWDPDTRQPRTARPFEARTVTCVDGTERSLILPDENTMTFAVTDDGRRYASLVTPKVRTIARNQFDCQSLDGAQLENQPTRSESCTGDHWDESLFYPEALSGVISPTANILSSLTLALMEDSGWYRADYAMTRMSPWGLGRGCDFITQPCLVPDGGGAAPALPDYARGYFCNEEGQRGCSSELTHKSACTILDYYYVVPQELPPERYQYFPSEPSKGGPRQADYCPVFGSPYGDATIEGLSCTDSGNADSVNVYNEVYGDDSKCIPTTLGEARCYKTACVKEDQSFRINVRGEWFKCEYDYQEIDVVVGQGIIPITLVCPSLGQACPDLFCPFNCAGRGICNYAINVNGTTQPVCECFDPEDTSLGCSESQIPDGDFLDDGSGLLDNLEENFFDPLIAVFVDHPDKWNPASWAWAAGLLTIVLVLLLCICSSFWGGRGRKSSKF